MSGQVDDYDVFETVYVRDAHKVKRARNRVTEVTCFLKLIRRATASSERSFQHQVDILALEFERQSLLSQEYVWPARRISRDSQYTCKHGKTGSAAYLVLDWCQHGTFFSLQSAYEQPLTESVSRTYFHQLIDALAYCHQNRIVHWNLMSESLLLDDRYRLHLADFRGPDKTRKKDSVTPPEAIYGDVQSGAAVDIFCCGFALFTWVFRDSPFERAERTNIHYSKLLEDSPKFWVRKHKNLSVSDSLKSLLASMLAFDPAQRPTISEIKAHPWYKGDLLTPDALERDVKAKIEGSEMRKNAHCGNRANRYTAVGANSVFRAMPESSWSWSSSDVQSSGSGGSQATVPVYTPCPWKFSQLFVMHNPDTIWRCVSEVLKQQLFIEELHVSRPFKMKGEWVTDTGKIAFSVRLLDCTDMKYCIDFSLDGGLSLEFVQCFGEFTSLFAERWTTESL